MRKPSLGTYLNIMKKLPIFAIIFIFLILTPLGANKYYHWLLEPVSREQSYQIFVITPGASVTQIARNLKDGKLIKNSLAFRLLVVQMGIAKNIQAGDFRFSPHQSAREIAQELTHGAIDVWITFPEGVRVEEMAAIIEAKLKTPENDKYLFDKKEFIKEAKEGYMFPDTYLISKDATAQTIVDRLLATFGEKVDPKILEKGASNNLTSEEVIILASLIEKEAKTNEERPVIAGILLNRASAGIPLEVDATVRYAKGYDSAQNTWWAPVAARDYREVKSRYNTYLYPGLPPGPIANPGLESIRAAAEPADTDYLYYLHDREGKVHFAKTIEEHNQNIRQFL